MVVRVIHPCDPAEDARLIAQKVIDVIADDECPFREKGNGCVGRIGRYDAIFADRVEIHVKKVSIAVFAGYMNIS